MMCPAVSLVRCNKIKLIYVCTLFVYYLFIASTCYDGVVFITVVVT